jgi:hypothetical protein
MVSSDRTAGGAATSSVLASPRPTLVSGEAVSGVDDASGALVGDDSGSSPTQARSSAAADDASREHGEATIMTPRLYLS